MDFDKLGSLFKIRGMDLYELKNSYNKLTHRAVESLFVESKGECGDSRRIREYSLAYRQVLLHRAINLFLGSLTSLAENNAYSMVLSIRGHFETTAALGYLHNRLISLKDGNLDAVVVDHDVCVLLLGTRDKEILKSEKARQNAMDSKHVQDMLEYADKSVSRHILQDIAKAHSMLTECYNHLCEFSHPNFHSNSAAFELKREEKKFYFKHNKSLEDDYFMLIYYLLISNPLFIELFDMVKKVLP